MRIRPARFIEACGGMAAVSCVLQAGVRAKPPANRPGNKHGYAEPVLGAFGLHPGQGADRYTWCEPEAGLQDLLRAYGSPQDIEAIAARIEGWIGEEARPLWDRLRAEPIGTGPDAAARWLILQLWSFSQKGPAHGWGGPGCPVRTTKAGWTTEQRDAAIERPRIIARVRALLDYGFRNVEVFADADDPTPDGDAADTVVFIDGSYKNLTAYKHNLWRDRAVATGRRWHEAGARVALSEAEPLELGPAWESIEITGARRGNKRTYGDTPEWLTVNRPGLERVAVQVSFAFPA